MKKTFAIFLVSLMLICLAGCVTDKTEGLQAEPEATAVPTPTNTPEPTDKPTPAPTATPKPTAEPTGKLDAIEDSLQDYGYQIVDNKIGSGATGFDIYVVSAYSLDIQHYRVSTDEETLLSALQGVNLVDGEEASWGYYITTVDGLTADYDGKQEYWSIFDYNDSTGKFRDLEASVSATKIAADSVYMFMMYTG